MQILYSVGREEKHKKEIKILILLRPLKYRGWGLIDG